MVKVRRCTEAGDAPGSPGAKRENIGSIGALSNAARRDAALAECRRTFTTGCWGNPAGMSRHQVVRWAMVIWSLYEVPGYLVIDEFVDVDWFRFSLGEAAIRTRDPLEHRTFRN
ncbi:MAG: hypothetical protein ABJA98_20495 [Acidobacteriota bacterium]